MAVIGGSVGQRLLQLISPHGPPDLRSTGARSDHNKLEVLFGQQIWDELHGKDVIDFGCGTGGDALAVAQRGARTVVGIDIREPLLLQAREAARAADVAHRCIFASEASGKADVLLSIDSFEHFADPAGVLRLMYSLLREGGVAMIAFGPPWYHPLGGHLFSVFPWAHLIFSESALLQWRAGFKSDGARRFGEVEGGLNQMTVGRFESLIAASRFSVQSFDVLPIRQARLIANRATREFTTSLVRCRLVPQG